MAVAANINKYAPDELVVQMGGALSQFVKLTEGALVGAGLCVVSASAGSNVERGYHFPLVAAAVLFLHSWPLWKALLLGVPVSRSATTMRVRCMCATA